MAPKPVAKAEPAPVMSLDNFNFSLPPGQPKLKLDLPDHDLHEPKPFMGPPAFESQPFKLPRLGVSEDLGNNTVFNVDATFKHGAGVKVGIKKTF